MRIWSFFRVIAAIAGLALATAAAPASAQVQAEAEQTSVPTRAEVEKLIASHSSGVTTAALPACRHLTTFQLGGGFYVQAPTTAAGNGQVDCVLERGDRNWGVVALQQWIHFCGGPQVEVDGIYGRITEDAIIWTQAANGISVDGDYGPQTRDVLPWSMFRGNHQFFECLPPE